MVKQKLRKKAKNITNQPKLKKKVAEYLVSIRDKPTAEEINEMFLKGHRGYLSMSEKELTNLFDCNYDKLCSLKKKIDKETIDRSVGVKIRSYWQWHDEKIHIEHELVRAQDIIDVLFEETFL